MRILFFLCLFLFSFIDKDMQSDIHIATWYDTHGHPKVHREHSTAAYNHLPLKTKIIVINLSNNKSDTVEVTDRMGKNSRNHIDLSKKSFGKLANHGVGKIKVRLIPLLK